MKNKKLKTCFLIIPAATLVLLLLNSFVFKDKRKPDKKTETVKLFTSQAQLARANNKDLLINAVLRSTDGGATWKDVSKTPPYIERPALEKFKVKQEGVLIATSKNGIIRSTDNGKHWKTVVSEDGGGIAVSTIKGGFTAITFNKAFKSNKIRISLDKGETWQSIDKGLPTTISSVKQIGSYLTAGHMGGLFRSADMGKTWMRVLCAIPVHKQSEMIQRGISLPGIFLRNAREFVLRLYVSGNAIYAVSEPAGC